MDNSGSQTAALVGGILAAFGASLCCLGPVILVSLGISGSAMSSLMMFDPLRPYFIAVVITLFIWAGWKLYRPLTACTESDTCSKPVNRHRSRVIFCAAGLLAMLFITSPSWLRLIPL